eukprot:scpid99761/ scgid22382/ 
MGFSLHHHCHWLIVIPGTCIPATSYTYMTCHPYRPRPCQARAMEFPTCIGARPARGKDSQPQLSLSGPGFIMVSNSMVIALSQSIWLMGGVPGWSKLGM